MRYKNDKNIKFVITRFVFSNSKCTKIRFWPGLRTGPRWESLRRSPRPSSRLGRGIPPSHSPTRSTPSPSRTRRPTAPRRRLGSQAPQHKILATPVFVTLSVNNKIIIGLQKSYYITPSKLLAGLRGALREGGGRREGLGRGKGEWRRESIGEG